MTTLTKIGVDVNIFLDIRLNFTIKIGGGLAPTANYNVV